MKNKETECENPDHRKDGLKSENPMNDFGPKRPMLEDALCVSACTEKAKRGRPKKKPGYDKTEVIDELLLRVVEAFGMPYDDREERSEDAPTIVSVAGALGVTPIKVRKMLITAGYYSTEISRKVQALRDEGYNQTRYENYLEKHIQQYLDDIALCPEWTLVDFYVDHGQSAPRMECSKEWCRLLEDCFNGKVDLVVTQKVSNVSSDWKEMTFWARILAAQEHPVGIYFISEDIFTLASYYQTDLRDREMLPDDWEILPLDELDAPMLMTMEKPALLEQAEQMRIDESPETVE